LNHDIIWIEYQNLIFVNHTQFGSKEAKDFDLIMIKLIKSKFIHLS